MTNVSSPPTPEYATPAPRRGTPWLWIGLGCGLVALLVVMVLIGLLAFLFLARSSAVRSSSSPTLVAPVEMAPSPTTSPEPPAADR